MVIRIFRKNYQLMFRTIGSENAIIFSDPSMVLSNSLFSRYER